MKRALTVLALGLALAAPALADLALANARNCMTCHAVDKNLVGPAYQRVAARYANDRAALERLTVKIMKGGGGVWGPDAMPANPQVNEAEARKLAAWVLSRK